MCYGPRIGTQFHRRYKSPPLPDGVRMFPEYLRKAGYYTSNNSKTDYNAEAGKEVWDDSSNKASWRNRPDVKQPFFHMQSHAQSVVRLARSVDSEHQSHAIEPRKFFLVESLRR